MSLRVPVALRSKETFGQAFGRGQETHAQPRILVGQQKLMATGDCSDPFKTKTSPAQPRAPHVDVATHTTKSITAVSRVPSFSPDWASSTGLPEQPHAQLVYLARPQDAARITLLDRLGLLGRQDRLFELQVG